MITNHRDKYNTKYDYETIVRHRVDQLTAGRCADTLAVVVASDDVGRAMLRIIKRRGLLPDLLTDLGLCEFCQARRGSRI